MIGTGDLRAFEGIAYRQINIDQQLEHQLFE